jgi:hypothetical protein
VATAIELTARNRSGPIIAISALSMAAIRMNHQFDTPMCMNLRTASAVHPFLPRRGRDAMTPPQHEREYQSKDIHGHNIGYGMSIFKILTDTNPHDILFMLSFLSCSWFF